MDWSPILLDHQELALVWVLQLKDILRNTGQDSILFGTLISIPPNTMAVFLGARCLLETCDSMTLDHSN